MMQNGVLGAPGLLKSGPGVSRGGPGEVPGGPGEVPGRSRGGPGARGAPGGALGSVGARFWAPPGTILSTILEQFFVYFRIRFWNNFCTNLCCRSGVFWGPFWSHFGDILVAKFRYEKCFVFEHAPWSPRSPPQGQKSGFSLEGCSKSRVALFASGCLRERF